MSADRQAIRVADRRELRAYLDQNPCECGGPLDIASETSSDGDGGQIGLELSCALCGLRSRMDVEFTGSQFPKEPADPGPDRLPQPREHHYIFGHVAVPQFYLGDPAGFISAFPCSDLGNGRLLRLWTNVGQNSDEALPPNGLQMRRETICGVPCPVIVMPETAGAAEVAFAALFRRDPEDSTTARYLVLERTEVADSSEPFGVICEWFADRRRKNHERYCKTELASFIKAFEQLLQDEEQLGSEGAFGLRSWQPDTDDPKDLGFDRAGYRRPLCRLAFESIPKCLKEEIDALVQGVETGEGHAALIRALETRLSSGDERRRALSVLAAESDVHEVRMGDWRLLVIAMPRPLAAPEPQYIAAVFDRHTETLARAYDCIAVYTSEVTIPGGSAPRLLCRISEDNHSIISDLNYPSPEEFFGAIVQHLSGAHAPCKTNTLEHMILYAAIHSQQ